MGKLEESVTCAAAQPATRLSRPISRSEIMEAKVAGWKVTIGNNADYDHLIDSNGRIVAKRSTEIEAWMALPLDWRED